MLLVAYDGTYCFTLFDLGQYGSNNDNGVLIKQKMNELFQNEKLKVSLPSHFDNFPINSASYVILRDEIFPLITCLLNSFPCPFTDKQKIFAYRLSRKWRTTENAFGILTARWQIFHKPIRSSVVNAEWYT